jgi:hypothetical protein
VVADAEELVSAGAVVVRAIQSRQLSLDTVEQIIAALRAAGHLLADIEAEIVASGCWDRVKACCSRAPAPPK